MRVLFDFLVSALPWIAIGLFVACSCVTVKARNDGKEMGKFFWWMSWFPVGCFLFVAIMEQHGGNKSSATTWLMLGVINAVMNFANTQKEKE